MNYIVRKRGLGLESLRAIISSMSIKPTLRNDASFRRNRQGINKIITWGFVSNLGQNSGVINKDEAVSRASNKSGFRRLLNTNGLCPRTVFTLQDSIELNRTKDIIVRPRNHSQGRNLFVHRAGDEAGLRRTMGDIGSGFYASELIDKKYEYRVFVSNGRIVWVANKLPDDRTQVAWNVHQGGKFENVRFGNWDINVIKNAIGSFKLSGLTFGAVDVIVDSTGKAYTLEINTAPSINSPYRISCMAKLFDYYFTNDIINDMGLDMNFNETDWRRYIHPAVRPIE